MSQTSSAEIRPAGEVAPSGGGRAWLYRGMLLFATILWGAGFFITKDVMEVVGPSTVVGIRFLVAALLTFCIFRKRILANLNARFVGFGVLMGVLYYLGFFTQNVGLTDTTPGVNAFLTAAYCVMVPFFYWLVAGKRPTVVNVGAAVLCLVGIGLVSLDGDFAIGFGEGMSLLCAVFYAVHIALLGKFLGEVDPFTLAFLQFCTSGVIGMCVGLATETMPTLSAFVQPGVLGGLAYLAVCASFLACLAQTVGQVHVPASQAGLILCLESVFGVLFSVLFYGEVLTARVACGFAVIFLAIVASESLAGRRMPWQKKQTSC